MPPSEIFGIRKSAIRRKRNVLVASIVILASGIIAASRWNSLWYIDEYEGLPMSTPIGTPQASNWTNHNLPKQVFQSRIHRIPPGEWARLDNLKCRAQGVKEYPAESLDQRMPYAIMLGTMKSGTTALSRYLYQHPYLVRPRGHKEIHFFDIEYDDEIASEEGIPRKTTRRAYSQSLRDIIRDDGFQQMRGNSSMVVIDDSPRYLFWSDRVPARVLCVAPWAKTFAILRNPVDRAFSHYTMLSTSRRNKDVDISFEDWVEKDLLSLRELGVVRDWRSPGQFDSFAGSQAELEAWKAYTRTGTQGVLGRGLYAIQLRHWFKAYEDFGKDSSDIYIVSSERMRDNTEDIYREVLQFLELPYVPLKDSSEQYTGHYQNQMNLATREKLEKFFRPYNHQLYDLLGSTWNTTWER